MKFCPRCGSKLQSQRVAEAASTGGASDKSARMVGPPVACDCSSAQQFFSGTTFKGGREVCKRCDKSREPVSKEQQVFVFGVVGFAVVLVSVAALIIVPSISQNLSQAYKTGTIDNIAEACLAQIQRVDSDVDRVVEVSDAGDSFPRSPLSFTPVIDDVKRGEAICVFDLDADANSFAVERVRWGFSDGGSEKEAVIEPGAAPRLTTMEAEQPTPKPAPRVERSSGLTCSEAFREAAEVPLSQTNDREVTETLYACGSVDEWWATAKRYPDAFGASYYADSELPLYVSVACSGNNAAPVCKEAFIRGY